MRKLMIAVAAVVGMAVAAGCSDHDRAAQDRKDLTRTELKANQDIANAREDAARQKADIDRRTEEKVADRQQDVADKRQDLARDERNQVRDRDHELATDDKNLRTDSRLDSERAAATEGTVKGVLTSSSSSKLEIRDANGNKEKLKTDELTRVTENGRPVKITDFKQGTEVRASFALDKDHDKVARDVQVLNPVMK